MPKIARFLPRIAFAFFSPPPLSRRGSHSSAGLRSNPSSRSPAKALWNVYERDVIDSAV
ncbi:MAG TPA: hypothetical protein VN380_01980 [Thermoanaerobaculia bacterium]|jgi:hypothetical protein|nr:hypothetical protein [Thermoanaerobaculia bacterium]